MTWFEPEGVEWTPASRKLISARLLVVGIMCVPPAIVGAVLALMIGPWWWILAGGFVLLAAWSGWVCARLVTAHAWAECEDDLVVKRGRMVRSVSVIPYGRMQYVDVSAGPIARAFGIASVQLHTASPGADASLSGVPADEAARLRDRLTARGEARMAGL